MAKITSYRGKGIGGCNKKGRRKRRVAGGLGRGRAHGAAIGAHNSHPKRPDKRPAPAPAPQQHVHHHEHEHEHEHHHGAAYDEAIAQEGVGQHWDPDGVYGWDYRPHGAITMRNHLMRRHPGLRGKHRRPLTLTAKRHARETGYY